MDRELKQAVERVKRAQAARRARSAAVVTRYDLSDEEQQVLRSLNALGGSLGSHYLRRAGLAPATRRLRRKGLVDRGGSGIKLTATGRDAARSLTEHQQGEGLE